MSEFEVHFEPFLRLVDIGVGAPTDLEAAGTRSWAARGHFLLIGLDRDRALVHPVGEVADDGSLELIELREPGGGRFTAPLEIR